MPGGLFNIQGDIVAILDSNGTAVVQYKYDAWGRQIGCTFETGNDEAEALSVLNPFRYRGYVYDEETGIHYLRSRYYASAWCRMVNADCQLISGIMGKNTFTYCRNVPILCIDPNGQKTYIINGIGNDQKNGPPAYAKELARRLQQAGEADVSAIGVYHGQNSIWGKIKVTAQ